MEVEEVYSEGCRFPSMVVRMLIDLDGLNCPFAHHVPGITWPGCYARCFRHLPCLLRREELQAPSDTETYNVHLSGFLILTKPILGFVMKSKYNHLEVLEATR